MLTDEDLRGLAAIGYMMAGIIADAIISGSGEQAPAPMLGWSHEAVMAADRLLKALRDQGDPADPK